MELYIEKGTNYAYTLERIQNISFRSLRSVVVDFTKRLPVEFNKELYNSIQRGVCKLQNEPELNMYIYALGLMHEAKLQYAFEHLSKEFVDSPAIDIIDYGCGQAIGTICYADFLREKGYAQKVRRITLIEPSERALMRAALHVSCFFPKSEIITYQKEFDELDNNDINIDSNIPTLHIFSNVIDLADDYFDLKRLAKIINDKAIYGNQILCIEPYFDYINQDEKLKRFTEELDIETYYTKIFPKGTFVEGHDWSCNVVLGYINHQIQKDPETLVSENVTQFESTIKVLVHKGAKTIYNCHIKSVEYVDNIVRFHLYNPILGYVLDKGSGYRISEIKTFYTSLNSIFYALQEDEEYGWVSNAIIEIREIPQLLNSIFSGGYISILQQYIQKGEDCTNPFNANKSLDIHILDHNIIINHCISLKFSKVGEETADKIVDLLFSIVNCENIDILREIADIAELAGKYKDAYQYYKLAAEENFIDAQYKLGYYLYNGLGVDKDCTEAIKWYIKAAEQGHATAQNELGDCYYDGIGVDQDYEEAVKWYKKAAIQGVATSQCNLGYCYDTGRGIEVNNSEAVRWYRMAANQGNVIAQNNLGVCYKRGHGVEKNFTEAVKWYRKSAEQGYANAQFKLGLCYKTGEGVLQDFDEAIKWLIKAANQGHTSSDDILTELSEDFYNGAATLRTFNFSQKIHFNQEKVNWCIKVARHGYPRAQKLMGDYYSSISDNYNLKTAFEWYYKAAEQEDIDAMKKVASCYELGRGIEKDFVKAVKWYRKLAELGDKFAQYELGKLYKDGKGVAQNYDEAISLYLKAANQGLEVAQKDLLNYYSEGFNIDWLIKVAERDYVNAQFELGRLYQNGWEVEKSQEKAICWYLRAIENGCIDACLSLASLYESSDSPESYYEAAKLYRFAADKGNDIAIFRLAKLYALGYGVDESLTEALKWLDKHKWKKDGLYSIGEIFFIGKEVEQSYDKAIMWWKMAIEADSSDAKFMLGICYENGYGVEKSYKEALSWYLKVAESGNNHDVYSIIGGFYENGYGVDQSYVEAFKWYFRVADKGKDSNMQNIIGDYYLFGKGVEQSYQKAVEWYLKAAANGNQDAMLNLGNCYRYGNGVKRSYSEAIKWYKKSGTENAYKVLSEIYDNDKYLRNILNKFLFRIGRLK